MMVRAGRCPLGGYTPAREAPQSPCPPEGFATTIGPDPTPRSAMRPASRGFARPRATAGSIASPRLCLSLDPRLEAATSSRTPAFDRGDFLRHSCQLDAFTAHRECDLEHATPHIARNVAGARGAGGRRRLAGAPPPFDLAFCGAVRASTGAKLSAFFRDLADAGFGAAEDLAVISPRGAASDRRLATSRQDRPLGAARPLPSASSAGPRRVRRGEAVLDGALGARTAALDAAVSRRACRAAPVRRRCARSGARRGRLARRAAGGPRHRVTRIEQIVSTLERLARNRCLVRRAPHRARAVHHEGQAPPAADLGCVVSIAACFNSSPAITPTGSTSATAERTIPAHGDRPRGV